MRRSAASWDPLLLPIREVEVTSLYPRISRPEIGTRACRGTASSDRNAHLSLVAAPTYRGATHVPSDALAHAVSDRRVGAEKRGSAPRRVPSRRLVWACQG